MADNTSTSQISLSNHFLSAVGVLGCVAIFAALLFFTYIPDRGNEPWVSNFLNDEGLPPPPASELRNAEKEIAESYGWIDQEKGIVRVPQLRAMELVVEEHQGDQ